MHISFYDTNFKSEHFISFLEANQQKFSELEQIPPTIEDCFIELVSM
jgi:hypothetical protein